MGEVCASVPSLPTQGHAEFDIWEWDSLQPRKAFGNFVGYNTSDLKDGGKKVGRSLQPLELLVSYCLWPKPLLMKLLILCSRIYLN